MDDKTAASAGFVLAGVSLAASLSALQSGTSAGAASAVLAAVALAALGLRRYGRLERRVAATIAAVASAAVVGAALFVASRGAGLEGAVAAAGGGGAAVAAYADRVGLGREALGTRVATTLRATAVGAAGILAIYAWLLPIGLLVGVLAPGGVGQAGVVVLSTLASGAGTLTVVVLYLRWTGRGLPYLDVRWPSLRGVGYAVGGVVVILGGNVVASLAFQEVGLRTAQHSILRTAEADPSVLLALIPLSILVIGPGEELLYRNVVQKSLRRSFSPAAGVVVASAVFAAVHLPAYLDLTAGLLSTVNTLVIVFLLAMVLGAVYERTGNVVVSAAAHGAFNAVAFAASYAELTGLFG